MIPEENSWNRLGLKKPNVVIVRLRRGHEIDKSTKRNAEMITLNSVPLELSRLLTTLSIFLKAETWACVFPKRRMKASLHQFTPPAFFDGSHCSLTQAIGLGNPGRGSGMLPLHELGSSRQLLGIVRIKTVDRVIALEALHRFHCI